MKLHQLPTITIILLSLSILVMFFCVYVVWYKFSTPPYTPQALPYYIKHYSAIFLPFSIPFAFVAVSIIIAPRSMFVLSFTTLALSLTSYLSIATLNSGGSDAGYIYVINLLIFTFNASVLILFALLTKKSKNKHKP